MTRLIRKKRGVSVVISTLLVLAITIVGAMWISNLMSTSSLGTLNQTPKDIIMANSVLLVGYDTRDGATLSRISTLNNQPVDRKLCTESCVGSPNVFPLAGGTDFIVLQLWNKNTVEVPIKNIQVNGILHTWDTKTRNVVFDADANPPPTGRFPEDGKFSIIPHSNGGSLIQFGNQTMAGDQEVRLVIKLSPNVKGDFISGDIDLGKPLQILVKIGDTMNPAEFVILSGDTK